MGRRVTAEPRVFTGERERNSGIVKTVTAQVPGQALRSDFHACCLTESLSRAPRGQLYYYLCFTEQETEIQGAKPCTHNRYLSVRSPTQV